MTRSVFIPLVLMLHQTPTTETEPITCVLTSPVDGSTVSGRINVTAECSDNTVRVEFYENGNLVATVYKTPTNPPPVNFRFLRASK